MTKTILFLGALFFLLAMPAQAETTISFYLGRQSAAPSQVRGVHPDGGNYDSVFQWDGQSFAPPIYYGTKLTRWTGDAALEIEFTHAKVYADESSRTANGFKRFEFSDGLNLLTLNRLLRWPSPHTDFTLYGGAGVGIAFPHVDVLTNGDQRTYGYQLTGPAVRSVVGASLPLNGELGVFAEYQHTTSWNSGFLSHGGRFSTRVDTDALNIGLSRRF